MRTHVLVWMLMLAVGLTMMPWGPGAIASCIADPVPGRMFSYPAPEDVGVPTNTRIFVWTRLGVSASVFFGGTELERIRHGYELPLLEPYTTYSVDIYYQAVEGAAATETLTFTTGAGPLTEPPKAPVVSAVEAVRNTSLFTNGVVPSNAEPCQKVHQWHCYDTGQDIRVSFSADSRPVFWTIGHEAEVKGELMVRGSLWPGQCGQPEVVLHDWVDCVDLQVFNAAEMGSPAVEVCLPGKEPPEPGPELVDAGPELTPETQPNAVEPATGADTGCVGGRGQPPWAAGLLLFLLLGRRRPRPGLARPDPVPNQ